ncbi:MAG TPA: glycosyltransferase family 87 protein [Acidimicrobiales bacterium]|nr:glycosyltransferase family 87 protein [Acidimicrobiales bacterium]
MAWSTFVGLAVLVGATLFVVYRVAPQFGQFGDLYGRYSNLLTLRATGNIYSPYGIEAFTYPPSAIFLFWPLLWVPLSALTIAWTSLSVAMLVLSFGVMINQVSHVGRARALCAALWFAAFCVVAVPPVTEDIWWGQTGTLLVAAVVVDFLWVRGSSKGVLVGLATAFKIYPGLFIVTWMLRRQWREALTAIATATSTLVLALALWPSSTLTFFSSELFGGGELARFKSGTESLASSSITALFMRPPFHFQNVNNVINLSLMVLVVVAVLWAGHRLWLLGYPLSSLVIVFVGTAVGAPVAWDHYFVFAPLLLVIPIEFGWRASFARVATVCAVVMMLPWFVLRKSGHAYWWQSTIDFVSRNALLFASLALIGAAFSVRRARRGAAEFDTRASEPQMAELD